MFREDVTAAEKLSCLIYILLTLLVTIAIFMIFRRDVCGEFDLPQKHAHCPSCESLAGFGSSLSDYCSDCGHALISHCAECGEVCDTPFCKSCGAEQ